MPARSLRRVAALTGLIVAATVLPVGAAAAAGEPAPAPTGTPARVIVQLATPLTAADVRTPAGRAGLAAVRAAAVRRVHDSGARTTRGYESLPFLAVEATPGALRRLRAAPEVAAVLPDEVLHPALASTVPHVGGNAAWAAGADGTGQVVAVLDSGVESSHPFLAGKVVDEACFSASGDCPNGTSTQTGTGAAAPCSYDAATCPHGTHVAGIVAGVGASSAGVARGARIAAVQIFSRTTTGCPSGLTTCAIGWTSDLLAGLDHVAALHRTRPVAAVNLSVGGGSYAGTCDSAQTALARAVGTLRELGITTVAAAGNDYKANAMSAPACLSGVVAVGSTSLSDVVSSFSNSSPELDLLAPGEQVLSSWTLGRTAWSTGTSQAVPHVAGAVALLKQHRPAATVSQVTTAMAVSGRPVLDTRNARITPRLQVDSAMTALATAVDVVAAPAVSLSPSPSPTAEPTASPAPAPAPATSPSPSPAPTASPSPTASPAPTASPSPTAEPAPEPSAVRLSGEDRYATAATIYEAGFGCLQGGVSSAVLARGDAFADALAGSYLAGAQGTGVLLTAPGSVPAATLAALRGSGARTVHLLGGTSAISDAVAAQLAATPSYDCAGTRGPLLSVVRISGTNRYDTARRTAEHVGIAGVGTADATGNGTRLRTAVVASGLGFADALAAGPLSYAGAASVDRGNGRGFPTLLTSPTELAPEAAAALRALAVEQVLVPGGAAVVSPAVEAQLTGMGLRVVRLAGSNRSETAAKVAAFAVDRLGFPTAEVALARGDAFADALAGAAYAGARDTPLLLTASPTVLGDHTAAYLRAGAGRTTGITAFGGAGAISGATLAEALAALDG